MRWGFAVALLGVVSAWVQPRAALRCRWPPRLLHSWDPTGGSSGSDDGESWSEWDESAEYSDPWSEAANDTPLDVGSDAVDATYATEELDDASADAFIAAMQSETASQLMADEKRDSQRRRMVEAGATPEQINAFLGDDEEWADYTGDESELEKVIQTITDGTYAVDDDYVDPALLGVVDSHQVCVEGPLPPARIDPHEPWRARSRLQSHECAAPPPPDDPTATVACADWHRRRSKGL